MQPAADTLPTRAGKHRKLDELEVPTNPLLHRRAELVEDEVRPVLARLPRVAPTESDQAVIVVGGRQPEVRAGPVPLPHRVLPYGGVADPPEGLVPNVENALSMLGSRVVVVERNVDHRPIVAAGSDEPRSEHTSDR